MIKILIAEDQGLLSSALATILNLDQDLSVVGTADNGKTALELVEKLKPDVILTDIEMPDLSGLEVAEKLSDSEIKVIILTTFARDGYFERAVNAKVSAYLLKDTPSDELIAFIKNAIQGKTYFEPSLITGYMSSQRNPLSQREQEILILIEQGLTSKGIAQELFLTDGTIRNYISEIISKLEAKNRIEAVAKAKENGWMTER
ncbi:DNA-binding response regulator [Siminovitchia terrae]|uniref:DNA-binding response regulator n=1 Tax=Siminovitchia terrae TaxID=1914933 RepID=A0A429XAC6_SIMTE|nr:response regulator transcription factor [Siminovitchia terrae]RST60378.1 response regulator transcription factor [Siminovitchia terrae]GIN96880.1 DNA-binding response regulator [Siminovitchia terrae]